MNNSQLASCDNIRFDYDSQPVEGKHQDGANGDIGHVIVTGH
jgi:hypothetical protein